METRLSIQFVVWQDNSEKGEITLDLGYQGNMNIAFEMVLLKQTCLCWGQGGGEMEGGGFSNKGILLLFQDYLNFLNECLWIQMDL